MRFAIFVALLLGSPLASAQWTSHVDPFIGTGGTGHTFPGATMPFGMVQLSPDTRVDSSWEGCAGYYYDDPHIYGFSHTHLSGTGISDYGDIMFMPFYGDPTVDPEHYRSEFRHGTEEASPGYYAVTLDDEDIRVRLTTTTRAGLQEYTFPRTGWINVILDLTHRDRLVEGRALIENTLDRVQGVRRSSGWAEDQLLYYHTEFSRPFDEAIEYDGPEGTRQMIFRFRVEAGEKLLIKTGLSSADATGALRNLIHEMPGWDFEEIRQGGDTNWNRELGKIEIEGGSVEERTNFYTALYHTMIAPNIWSDVDGRYRGHDGEIHRADHNVYTVFSLWDTFRTLHPLLTLIDPDRTLDFVKTMLLIYEQGGRLPVWELAANETDTMIGFHSVPVIADAYAKGIRGFDAELALEAMIAASQHDEFGQPEFNERGFLSIEDESESVSKTLEYAYNHWVVSQMAEWLGHDDVADRQRWLSLGYRNMMDPDGFMRPRQNGGWLTPFDPREVNNHYTEANSWQYSFLVPHDIGGWMELLGGPEALENHLDALFTAPVETTGRDQADITGLIGQYAQGNEPSHHFAYLYHYVNEPHKSQQRVRQILTTLFQPTPDGLPGNEDCGQMSAWFVMSALGLYPVTPGTTDYLLVTPLFQQATVHHADGRSFTISTEGEGTYIRYSQIDSAMPQSNMTISHEALLGASHLKLMVSPDPLFIPNPKVDGVTYPVRSVTIPQVDDAGFVPTPIVSRGDRSFRGEQLIELTHREPDAVQILHSLEGSSDPTEWIAYEEPIHIDTTTVLHAIAVNSNGVTSAETRAEFIQRPNEWTITLDAEYAPQYSGGGNDALIDGIRGDEEWRKGDWQGFYDQDVIATVDFGEERSLSNVFASFLQDSRPWIIFPPEVIFETSLDGVNFTEVLRADSPYPPEHEESTVAEFGGNIGDLPTTARYLRMRAVTYGALPEWHLGAGRPAWVFVDEIWTD